MTRPAPSSEVKPLTVAEVARVLGVSKMTVYRLCHDGELLSIRVGRLIRIHPKALQDYEWRASAWWRDQQ